MQINKEKSSKLKPNILNVLIWIIGSFFIVFLGEALQRGSVNEAIKFIVSRNIVFFSNYMIVLAITSLSFLFRRMKSSYIVISILVMSFYIGNYFIEKLRGTPIMWADVYSIKDGA